MKKQDAFEATYPKYPFAPLVRLGIAIAAFLAGRAGKSGAKPGAAAMPGDTYGSAA